MIDVLYLCRGRLEFTKASLTNLLAQTDWSLVNEFVVYNDAATDGRETTEYLYETIGLSGVGGTVRLTNLGSPVSVMNHYLHRSSAELFAKIDSDIIVPQFWLDDLVGVMERNPELELLGMQPGMSGARPGTADGLYTFAAAPHIGGVGLMRASAFKERDKKLVANGFFGFTEWQHEQTPVRGWICPDLRMFALDCLPVEPWRSLTRHYIAEGLNRKWPNYDRNMEWYWSWWTDPAVEAAREELA